VADFDGDGCAEMAIRTCEGTVFGDGTEIPDTNGDGKIDYRTWGNLNTSKPGYLDHYNSAGPEFLSIIDGKTGRELARDNFIDRETSESWGDGYWKRACSFRVGVGCFDETGLPSVVLGRGVYGHSVIEAWDWRDGQLTKRWRFDTNDGGTGKDGKKHSTYASQGNHSLNVADLDGDGLDEVMYGSMAVDHDGIGLWNTGLGHGDANHVGKFLPEREGLQMFHCLETGKTMVALHDARDGSVIWKKDATSDNDMGRCLVGDFFPEYPGCEFFYYQGNYIKQDGTETTINTKGQKGGCGMAIWFDGSLSRQLIEDNIVQSPKYGRTFTMYRYSETFINGTKSNPSWYGDLVGDWREEIIVPDNTRLQDIKIFSTWYPTTHKFPWLMTDHCYWMSALNENIGYNQPTNTGYYLGSDLKSDAEAWAEAEKVQNVNIPTAINNAATYRTSVNSSIYNLSGQRVDVSYKGILIKNGKKVYNK
jgi:rhamnogalacturonan endolyase